MAKVNSVQDFFDGFKKFDINNADWNNMGSFPAVIRTIICLLVFGLMVGGVYYFKITDMSKQIDNLVVEEETLINAYKNKAYQVANLDQLLEQRDQIRSIFQEQLKRLPTGADLPDLLQDIEHAAKSSGLSVGKTFFGEQKSAELFIEQSMNLELTGTYHEFGSFVGSIAALPRIVTLHDFEVEPVNKDEPSKLRMSVLAKTYRYNDKGLSQ